MVVVGMMTVVAVFDQMADMADGEDCGKKEGYWVAWLIVESADRLYEVVLGEIAMMDDYWLFGSFFDCSESCAVVEMVDFVGCCNYGFSYFDLFVMVW